MEVRIKHELRERYCQLMNKARELYDQGQELSPEEQAEFHELSLRWCDVQFTDTTVQGENTKVIGF